MTGVRRWELLVGPTSQSGVNERAPHIIIIRWISIRKSQSAVRDSDGVLRDTGPSLCIYYAYILFFFFFLFYFWTLPFPFFRRTSGELGFGSASGSGHSLPPAARILWSSLPPSLLDPRAVRGEFAPAPVSTCRVRVRLAVIGSEDGEIPVLGNGLDSLRWGGPSVWLVSWIGLIKEFFFSLGGGGGGREKMVCRILEFDWRDGILQDSVIVLRWPRARCWFLKRR